METLFAFREGTLVMLVAELTAPAQAADWFMSDVQNDTARVVEVVDRLQRLGDGSDVATYEYSGNGWVATLSPDGLELEHKYFDDVYALPHADALAVAAQYWQCLLRLGLRERLAEDVRLFTEAHGRPPALSGLVDES